jgi:magnesium transporter
VPFGTDTFFASRVLLVVGLSLTAQVGSSTLIGAALPMLASAAKLDPAIVASPAITTVVDVLGLFIYFGLAAMLLGI